MEYSELIVTHLKLVSGRYMNFVTSDNGCLSRDGLDQHQYTGILWHLLHYVCAQKIFLTALHQQKPKLFMQGSMDHRFMLFMPNSDMAIRMLQLKLGLVTPGNVFQIFYCTVVVSL